MTARDRLSQLLRQLFLEDPKLPREMAIEQLRADPANAALFAAIDRGGLGERIYIPPRQVGARS